MGGVLSTTLGKHTEINWLQQNCYDSPMYRKLSDWYRSSPPPVSVVARFLHWTPVWKALATLRNHFAEAEGILPTGNIQFSMFFTSVEQFVKCGELDSEWKVTFRRFDFLHNWIGECFPGSPGSVGQGKRTEQVKHILVRKQTNCKTTRNGGRVERGSKWKWGGVSNFI